MDWLIPVIIVVVLAAAVGIWLWVSCTSLVQLNARVDEAWADLTAQRARRAELAAALLVLVRGYAAHEKALLDGAAAACEASERAATPADAGSAEGAVQRTLKPLFAVAEGYPQLQSSPEFLRVQHSLAETEDKIQASRRFYNGGVRELNTKRTAFPAKMFAHRLGVEEREYFDLVGGTAVSAPPRVQF
ncbi:LemA family protein [Microbacterium hominis]|uniref:LemA family protein n=1 Tax=Microbacterium hominis TaxID=162426 RepID=A0A7D4Q0A6_9MICO|nr:LemA family protein [Microbacterium hominis]QKJ19052.1 LemA family protein [Microbacterium hominis]